jgi:hypothetical protein
MLVATLEDLTGSVEVVVFPKVYEQTAPAWSDDSIVLVSGRLDRRDEAPQILCEAVWSWEDATRLGVAAFGAERDRALAPRGRWERNGKPAREAIPVETPAPVAVAVAETVGAPEPAEEPSAPIDAVPLQSAPIGSAGMVAVMIGEEVPNDQLLGAIESVKSALATRPGPLPVELWISVAGASRQVRLPDRVAWDDRLADAVRRAAGVPVAVELRPGVEERIA